MHSKLVPRASLPVREAIGIRGSVAAFQADLVRAQPVKLNEEFFIEFHPALRMRVDLHHPALHAIGIELLVPRGVKGVGEIDALSVAADLDHLWTTVERLFGLARVSRAA